MLVRHTQTSSRCARLALVAGAALFALRVAAPAAAQDTAPAQEDEVGELVVTARGYVPTVNTSATKQAIPLIETPQAITVIPRDQIDVLNMQNLSQAVRYSAGIIAENFGADERFDWLTLRGFQPVQYIDGLQAAAGSTGTSGLDLWGAESIEVLKGPSGVLYGQTPPGGIVNYTSRRPKKAFGGEAQVQGGTFGDWQVAADVTGTLQNTENLFGRATILYRDHDTQIDGAHAERFFFAPALTWNVTDDTNFTFLSYYQHDEATGGDGGFLPASGTILPNPGGKIAVSFNPGEPGFNIFTREQYGFGYEFNHYFTENFRVVQNLKYARENENFQSIYGTGLLPDGHTLTRANFGFPEDIKSFAVDTRAELKATTGMFTHSAMAGFDFREIKNHTDFIFGSAPSIDIFNPVYGAAIPAPFFVSTPYILSNSRQLGFYAQDSMKIDKVRLTVSARHDKITGPVDDDATTYRVGLNYIFDAGIAPYIAYATSFLPTAGADFAGNAFKPSEGKQVEAGIKYEPRNLPKGYKVFASAVVYDLVQDNVLASDPAHAFFSVQTAEVKVKGLELEAVARIRERLTTNISYSYTDTDIPIVPKNKAALLVDYTWQEGQIKGFGAGLGVRYLGPSFGDASHYYESSSQTLFDAILHYDFMPYRVSLNANNLFDKVDIQRCSDANNCFYSQRRTILVTVGRKW